MLLAGASSWWIFGQHVIATGIKDCTAGGTEYLNLPYDLVPTHIVLQTGNGSARPATTWRKRRHCTQTLQLTLLGFAGRRRWARACRC